MKTAFVIILFVLFWAPFNYAEVNKSIDSSLLIGKWENLEGPFLTKYEIYPDGSFFGLLYQNGTMLMKSNGTWEIIGNKIKWVHIKSIPKELSGQIDYDEIIQFSNTSFKIKGDNGEIREYNRPKDS